MLNKILVLLACALITFSAAGTALAKNIDSGVWDITSQIESRLPPVTGSKKLTIVIVDFTDLDGNQSKVGKLMAEELITRLSQNAKLRVIERKLLKKIADENKLSLSGLVDENTAKQLGKILGAEILCSGTVAVLGSKVRVNARVVKTETGELVSTGGSEIDDESLYDSIGYQPPRKDNTGGDNGRRTDERKPRRIASITGMHFPRVIENGVFASRMLVSDSGLFAEVQAGLFNVLSLGVSEDIDGLFGSGAVRFYIPSIHLKFSIISDINKFSLAAGIDTFAYSLYTITNMMYGITNALPFAVQGLYLCGGWGFSAFGEDDMISAGIRFPLLPIEVINPLNFSGYVAAAIGITRYFVLGIGLDSIYPINPIRWAEILPTVSLSFIPVNNIDITIVLQYEIPNGRLARTLSFGYEYRF